MRASARFAICALGCALMALAVPAQGGYSVDELRDHIETVLADFDRPDVPGVSFAVYQGGETVLAGGFGLANLESGALCDETTNHRLASVTKQFTAMAILVLREQGMLTLDDPITRFFPDFPEIGEQITVRNLLNHTSGVIAYEDLMPEGQTEQVHDRDALNLVMTQHGTYFTPGTQYRYSNSGYAILATIVEEVSGQRHADFLRENIFEPIGMAHTVAFEEGISEVSNRAYGYRSTEDGFEFRDQSSTSAVLGDGGVYTSVTDMLQWEREIREPTLISAESLQEAFTPPTLPDGTNTGYGFGWRIEERNGENLIYHTGSTCGFSTAFYRVPARDLAVVVLTNRADGGARDRALSILDWLIEHGGE